MGSEQRIRTSRMAALGQLRAHLEQHGAVSAYQRILQYIEVVLELNDVSELSLC